MMLARCENPKNKSFHRYGGRGIKVCERWHDFDSFVEDIEREIGSRPDNCTLDRIDNDDHYEAGKVQWATRRHQSANRTVSAETERRRRQVWVLYQAGTRSPLVISRELGIKRHVAADDIEWIEGRVEAKQLWRRLAEAERRVQELEAELRSLR